MRVYKTLYLSLVFAGITVACRSTNDSSSEVEAQKSQTNSPDDNLNFTRELKEKVKKTLESKDIDAATGITKCNQLGDLEAKPSNKSIFCVKVNTENEDDYATVVKIYPPGKIIMSSSGQVSFVTVHVVGEITPHPRATSGN